MTPEELEDWQNVAYRMNNEGFHYCFHGYSSFKEIQDEEFHRLRKAYLAAADTLKTYVNNKVKE